VVGKVDEDLERRRCCYRFEVHVINAKDFETVHKILSNMEKGKQRSSGGPYEVLLYSEEYGSPGSDPDPYVGIYDQPLPCCGCGIGWFSFLVGFIFPLLWYYGSIRFFWTQRQNDPTARPGLAACAIAALVSTVALATTLVILLILHEI